MLGSALHLRATRAKLQEHIRKIQEKRARSQTLSGPEAARSGCEMNAGGIVHASCMDAGPRRGCRAATRVGVDSGWWLVAGEELLKAKDD
jgi:hypothetical protein